METVEDWFRWRFTEKKELSVEKIHAKLIQHLGWDRTDVLYSFLGIYTIGLLAFYPQEFYLPNSGSQIKLRSCSQQRVYSRKFLCENYSKYPELNCAQELLGFPAKYRSVGNIYPIWPGGNVDKGICGLYDLPEFYFRKYPKWAQLLLDTYPEAKLTPVIDLDNSENIQSFLQKMIPNQESGKSQGTEVARAKGKYIDFLRHICHVIDSREAAILGFAKEHGFDTSEYEP